jgi:excisionase family DNA binding protein
MEQSEQSIQGKEFLTIQDLSKYLAIKASTLYTMVGEKRVPHYKIGRMLRFKRSEIDLWMEGNRKQCVDPKKVVRKALRPPKGAKQDVGRIIRKAIDEGKREGYTTPHGKPDQVKGLGKEVLNGTL